MGAHATLALLQSFVRKQLPHLDWVDDVVQETLISIHQDRHTYDPSRSFSSWMYAIARHRVVDFVRRQRRHAKQEQLVERSASEFAPVAVPDGNLFERLHHALQRISGKQREVIQLLKWSDLSIREVSQYTGMSEASVKINAHRGYKNLRKLIAGRLNED